MAVTTKDIANICGVSRGTVDRALNGKDRISPTTKEKILKVATEMNYRPDLLARSLVTGSTMTIGILMVDIMNRHFSQMAKSMSSTAIENGYFANISMQDQDKDIEINIINSFVDHRVDGIVLSPVNKGLEFEKFLASLSIPIVLIGGGFSKNFVSIEIDEEKAGYDATYSIIDKGYEHIVFVAPPLEDSQEKYRYGHENRLCGFLKAVSENKFLKYHVIGKWEYVNLSKEIMINFKNKKIAFLCTADIYALEIMTSFKKIGFKTNRDYGLMGFDNIDVLDIITPRLNSVDNAVNETGKKSVELLIKLINKEKVKRRNILKHKIINGETL